MKIEHKQVNKRQFKGGGRSHRTDAQVADDDADIARIYLQGETQRGIVKWIAANRHYTLSLAMINKSIQQAVAGWRASAAASIEEKKARDLEQLNETERKATIAFERSCNESVKVLKESKAGRGKSKRRSPVKVCTTTEGRDGDPRFLAIILDCIEKRAKILGYNAPVKQFITTPPNEPLQTEDVSKPVKVPKARIHELLALLAGKEQEEKA